MGGGYNVVLSPSEKEENYSIRDPLRELVDDLIIDWDLFEPKAVKGKFI
jgi:hypothetical protein